MTRKPLHSFRKNQPAKKGYQFKPVPEPIKERLEAAAKKFNAEIADVMKDVVYSQAQKHWSLMDYEVGEEAYQRLKKACGGDEELYRKADTFLKKLLTDMKALAPKTSTNLNPIDYVTIKMKAGAMGGRE